MNWTGGNLQRHSRKPTTAANSRQKQHFARVRNRLLNQTTSRSPIKWGVFNEIEQGRQESLERTSSSQTPHHLPTSTSTNCPTSKQPSQPRTVPTKSASPSKQSYSARRSNLLQKQDWLGISNNIPKKRPRSPETMPVNDPPRQRHLWRDTPPRRGSNVPGTPPRQGSPLRERRTPLRERTRPGRGRGPGGVRTTPRPTAASEAIKVYEDPDCRQADHRDVTPEPPSRGSERVPDHDMTVTRSLRRQLSNDRLYFHQSDEPVLNHTRSEAASWRRRYAEQEAEDLAAVRAANRARARAFGTGGSSTFDMPSTRNVSPAGSGVAGESSIFDIPMTRNVPQARSDVAGEPSIFDMPSTSNAHPARSGVADESSVDSSIPRPVSPPVRSAGSSPRRYIPRERGVAGESSVDRSSPRTVSLPVRPADPGPRPYVQPYVTTETVGGPYSALDGNNTYWGYRRTTKAQAGSQKHLLQTSSTDDSNKAQRGSGLSTMSFLENFDDAAWKSWLVPQEPDTRPGSSTRIREAQVQTKESFISNPRVPLPRVPLPRVPLQRVPLQRAPSPRVTGTTHRAHAAPLPPRTGQTDEDVEKAWRQFVFGSSNSSPVESASLSSNVPQSAAADLGSSRAAHPLSLSARSSPPVMQAVTRPALPAAADSESSRAAHSHSLPAQSTSPLTQAVTRPTLSSAEATVGSSGDLPSSARKVVFTRPKPYKGVQSKASFEASPERLEGRIRGRDGNGNQQVPKKARRKRDVYSLPSTSDDADSIED